MGVGVATAISQWISCILIVIYLMRTDGPCRLRLSMLRINKRKFQRILTIGLPAGLQSALFSISNILIQSSVNSFGPAIVAANTASANIETYIYATQNTLYHASLTFVAQNMGAGNYRRMKQSILHCIWIVIAVGLTVGGAIYIFRNGLLNVYAPGNESVLTYGVVRATVFCFTYFLCGIMEVGSGALRGIGKSFVSMIVSLIGSCVLRIVWIFSVFRMLPIEPTVENTKFRLFMLYVSYPVTWIITSIALYLMFAICLRSIKRQHPEP
jgi:Na+-driven multidrug efflux pump